MLVKHISGGDRNKLAFLGFLGIFFLGFLIYSNILHAPFVYDDYSAIVDNETVKSIKTAFRNVSNNRYVVDLSFALNHAAGGIKPFGYHLVNNLVHVFNALLVYWFILLTFQTPAMQNARLSPKFIAFSCAFIFVAHPIQTQAITFVTQRFASLATLFYLLSLVMYAKARLFFLIGGEEKRSRGHGRFLILYGISLLFAALAMKSKEIAVTLPVMITLYEFSFFSENRSNKIRGQNMQRFFFLLPLLLTMLIIPLSMMDFSKPAETIVESIDTQSKETLSIGRMDYLLTEFRVIVTYLRLLVFPVKQSIDYTYPVYHSFLQMQVFSSFLLLVLIFSLGIYLFYRSRRSSSPAFLLIAFGIFWFFITLSVESTIIPIKDVIFEHRLYLPSAGFFVTAITAFDYVIRQEKIKIGIVIVLVVILSVSTYSRNRIWQDPQILWDDVLEKYPNNVRAYNALGVIYKNEAQYEKAAAEFQKILKINAGFPPAYYNLGDIRLKLGDYEGAIAYFQKALTLPLSYHFHLDTLTALAIAYSESGDTEHAVATFQTAIRKFPTTVSPYNNLGRQYIKMGEADLSIQVLEQGLKIRESPYLYYNLSRAYALKNDKRMSDYMHQKAVSFME